jgi:GT2 family glycosyltransferase
MRLPRRLYPQELLKLQAAAHAGAAPQPWPYGDEPSVTVAVVTLDRLALTRRCLASLFATRPEYPFDLLIVDNGSAPEMVAYLHEIEAQQPGVRILFEQTNLGCGQARNLAFQTAQSDFVFSLDNDTICHPGWLREAVACAVRWRGRVVAPLRLQMDGTLHAAGAELRRTRGDTPDTPDRIEIERWFHDLSPDWLQTALGEGALCSNFAPGGLSLYDRSLFLELGGFADGYKVGFEDMDFALLLVQAGYTVYSAHRSLVTHDDTWQAQAPIDADYAAERNDMTDLRRGAARFQQRWGADAFAEAHAAAFAARQKRQRGAFA